MFADWLRLAPRQGTLLNTRARERVVCLNQRIISATTELSLSPTDLSSDSTLAQATFLAPEAAGKRLVGDRLPDEFGDIHDEV